MIPTPINIPPVMRLWRASGFRTLFADPNNDVLFALRERFQLGQPIDDWRPWRYKADPEEPEAPLADINFCDCDSGFIAFSEHAVNAIGDVLRASGQLLPLETDVGPHWVYNVTNVIDALDRERSKILYHRGRVYKVRQFVWRDEVIAGQMVFKIPERLRGETFVTRAFRELVHQHELRGFAFATPQDPGP